MMRGSSDAIGPLGIYADAEKCKGFLLRVYYPREPYSLSRLVILVFLKFCMGPGRLSMSRMVRAVRQSTRQAPWQAKDTANATVRTDTETRQPITPKHTDQCTRANTFHTPQRPHAQ